MFNPTTALKVVATEHQTYEQMKRPYFYEAWGPDVVVVEEFILRDNNFRANLTGVRVEGMIEVTYQRTPIVYRPPSKKAQVPDEILKAHGLWNTGSDVDWTDGRDANDAVIHLLGYVAFDLKHVPTLRKYFK